MDKYRNERWIVISVLGDLYELAEEGAKLRGYTQEEFVIEAVERASEEERK